MAMNFLFAEYLDELGCLCIQLADDGSAVKPLIHRTFADIQTMQAGSHTVIVLPSVHCGLHEVDLPWLGERKARAAIPYALEEQLAQKLSTLHFAFDHAHHSNNRYLVAVLDKSYLLNVIARLNDASIKFNEITLDWFSVAPGEVCLTQTAILVHTADFKGALFGSLANQYLMSLPESVEVLRFTDSATDWKYPEATEIDSPFLLWVAQRIQHVPRMNLCQGELSHGRPEEALSRPLLIASGALAGLWIFLVLCVNGVNLVRLNHQLNLVDKDIAVVYRKFFPNATQVISPKFRISQLLHTGQVNQSATVLWQLLDKFEKAINPDEYTVEQLEFKRQVLSVTLKSRDFTILEKLEARLKKANVKVAQTQASTHDENVVATLELRL